MKNKISAVILLTATIEPKGMGNIKLNNPEIRKKQYIEAINYYLDNTDLNIILCENSGIIIYDDILNNKKINRLEYLSFHGKEYDKRIGQAWGEAEIIKHAILHSNYNFDIIIKISGRLKILNINSIINKITPCDNSIACEFLFKEFVNSTCFVAPKHYLLDLSSNFLKIDVISYPLSMEKYLWDGFLKSKNLKIKSIYPKIEGISATFNKPYNSMKEYSNDLVFRRLNNNALKKNFFYKRKAYLSFFCSSIKWGLYLILWKIQSLYKNKNESFCHYTIL